MAAEFDAMAANWAGERGGYRPPVLADALARGGPFGPGMAVEIASGTGLLTPLIAGVWPRVLAVDLSAGMLAALGGEAQGPGGRVPAAASRRVRGRRRHRRRAAVRGGGRTGHGR